MHRCCLLHSGLFRCWEVADQTSNIPLMTVYQSGTFNASQIILVRGYRWAGKSSFIIPYNGLRSGGPCNPVDWTNSCVISGSNDSSKLIRNYPSSHGGRRLTNIFGDLFNLKLVQPSRQTVQLDEAADACFSFLKPRMSSERLVNTKEIGNTRRDKTAYEHRGANPLSYLYTQKIRIVQQSGE